MKGKPPPAPYTRGIHAAYRMEEYNDFKTVPECPYPNSSNDYFKWWDGFGDGTKDLIHLRRNGLLNGKA